MLLHILGHVESEQGLLAAEQGGGQGLAQLGLANAGGAQEEEAPRGPLRVLEAHPAPPDGPGHRLHRLLLTHHPPVEGVLQVEQPLALRLGEGGDGHPRPAGHHGGHVLGGDRPGVLAGAPGGLLPLQLPAEVLLRVPEHGGLLKVLAPDGLLLLPAGLRHLLLQGAQLRRGAQPLHPHPGGGLVDEVDGLVGQAAIPDVPGGEGHGGVDGPVGDLEAVVGLVPIPQAPEDGPGGVLVGLGHQHGLEPPLQGGVLLDILPVLVGGGGADDLQLPPAQGGLDDVGRVDGPLGGARPHDGVELVDEEDDVAHPAHLGQDVLHPLLKFPPVLGARHHGGEIQGHEALGAQLVGHVPGHHPAGQALGHGGLAHAGLADEGGVVLLPAGEDLDDPLDLLLPAHHRIQHAPGGQAGEIPGELLQQPGVAAVLPLPGLAASPEGGGGGIAPHGGHHVGVEPPGLCPHAGEHPHRHAVPLPEDAQQQVLGAHIVVAQPGRLRQGELDDLLAPGGEALGRGAARGAHPHQAGDGGFQAFGLHPGGLEHLGGHPLALPGQAQQQVLAAHVAVAQLRRALLGQTEGRLGPLGKSGLVHVPLTSSVPAPRKAYPVLLDVLHPLCHAPSPLFCAGVGCSEAPRPAPGSGSRRPPCEMARICPWKTAPPPVDRILFFPTMKKYTHSRGNLALQFSKVMVQ